LILSLSPFSIQSDIDYRFSEDKGHANMKTFYYPNDKYNNTEIEKTYTFLSKQDHYEEKTLEVYEVGREMTIDECGGGVAVFEFEDICEGNYASADYITICRNFHSVILKNVQKLTPDKRNVMKRFISLVTSNLLANFSK